MPYLAYCSLSPLATTTTSIADLPRSECSRECVAEVMSQRGLLTVDTGAAGRGPGSFDDLVSSVGESLGLISAPSAAPHRTHANEEGVDTVSHLSWDDQRAGHWVFIGQATCARSNEWGGKIEEPESRAVGTDAHLRRPAHRIPRGASPHRGRATDDAVE